MAQIPLFDPETGKSWHHLNPGQFGGYDISVNRTRPTWAVQRGERSTFTGLWRRKTAQHLAEHTERKARGD